MMEVFLGGLVLCCLSSSVWCQSATDAKNLKTKLFTTNAYDKKIRPVTNQSEATFVEVEFYLLAINSLDEVAETLKTTGFLKLSWKDEFLTWDPDSYGGITKGFYPQDDVWKPDAALKNSYLKYEKLGDTSLNVWVTNDGEIQWAPFQVFQSTCSINIKYFPFDQQVCSLKFVAWSYEKEQVEMEGGTGGISLEEYQENSAWDIISSRWYTIDEKDEASIVFELTLERKPLYNILTLVFPVIMLATLNLFVFVLPSDGGEKAGYAVTVFLAFAVFMTIMESSFPENSETVAYLSVFVVMQTLQSTLITMVALVMVRLASLDETTKIPGCLIVFARLSKCLTLRRNLKSQRVEPKELNVDINQVNVETNNKKQVEKCPDKTTEHGVEYTWRCVANALDVFFFVFFLLAFLIGALVCLLLAKYH